MYRKVRSDVLGNWSSQPPPPQKLPAPAGGGDDDGDDDDNDDDDYDNDDDGQDSREKIGENQLRPGAPKISERLGQK